MREVRWKALPHLAESLKNFFRSREKGIDKRVHPRARSRNLVKAQSDDRLTYRENLSNMVDLSETGLRFTSRNKVKVGTVLHMTINLAEKETQVPVTGIVVWNRQIRTGNPGYYIGVSFVQIRDDHRHLMHEIVKAYRERRKRRV